jgi:large subunit ribosomal protein L6
MAEKNEGRTEIIEIPKGVTVSVLDKGFVKAVGPKGEAQKKLKNPLVKIVVNQNNIELSTIRFTKRDKKMLYSFYAHVNNLVKGVVNGFTYKLKVCSGHFPMTVTVKGNEFTVKNLFGAAVPRVMVIKDGVKVIVTKDIIDVSGTNLEIVSQVSADIEKLTRRSQYDRRVFQDGIYIIEKNGNPI